MISIRRGLERGRTALGWLDSRHTFSFGDYHDPRHQGFGPLRVINEDVVAAGAGFATHGHRDMEIISIVLAGALAHEDSLGNGSIIRPGEVQRMTAGSGIRHSEFNASKTEPVHFLQVWIAPRQPGLPPGYEQRGFPAAAGAGRLRLLASADGRDGAVTVHQDVAIFDAALAAGNSVRHGLGSGRIAWVQVVRGAVVLAGETLDAGDGAAISGEAEVALSAVANADALVFDLPQQS